MALKTLLSKKEFDELPDALKEHYTEEGDSYVLGTDDSSFKSKINEFRNNNVELLRKQEELKAQIKQFDGIDPEKAREATAKLLELEDQQLIDEGKMEELLEKRTERMRSEFEHKYNALNEAHESLKGANHKTEEALQGQMIEARIAQAVNGVGTVVKGAMPDILNRARAIWKLDDNLQLVAKKDDLPILGNDGVKPLTPEEYAAGVLQEAPWFFEGSSGGAAGGNDKSGNNAGNVGTIPRNDKSAFGNNLEDIASGKVRVSTE